MDTPVVIDGWAAGLTLWTIAALVVAIVFGLIVEARNTQVPTDGTDSSGGTMHAYDRDDFESDVYDSVGESLYIDSAGNIGDGDVLFIAIGETVLGDLYGYEENTYGQRAIQLFDSEAEQRQWFETVSAYINETEQDW